MSIYHKKYFVKTVEFHLKLYRVKTYCTMFFLRYRLGKIGKENQGYLLYVNYHKRNCLIFNKLLVITNDMISRFCPLNAFS